MNDFNFPDGTKLPKQLGVCLYCDHYLAATDMGNGVAAIIPTYSDTGYMWQHACTNHDNPGDTHELVGVAHPSATSHCADGRHADCPTGTLWGFAWFRCPCDCHRPVADES